MVPSSGSSSLRTFVPGTWLATCRPWPLCWKTLGNCTFSWVKTWWDPCSRRMPRSWTPGLYWPNTDAKARATDGFSATFKTTGCRLEKEEEEEEGGGCILLLLLLLLEFPSLWGRDSKRSPGQWYAFVGSHDGPWSIDRQVFGLTVSLQKIV